MDHYPGTKWPDEPEEMSMETTETKTATVSVKGSVTVEDMGGGVYRVDGSFVAGAPKMLAEVSAALGIQPKPRAPRKAGKKEK
jgi:hypothetical protein